MKYPSSNLNDCKLWRTEYCQKEGLGSVPKVSDVFREHLSVLGLGKRHHDIVASSSMFVNIDF